ncbi:hypothetical protein GALMADRAFT_215536 [Galerina marginata CBS 339.88]|uniref:Uncharacterized protein n=1 Tax=Galerina marginata (strain CBS 339.88) TaxID=685588 RepID=A0A067SDI9_GALM3|nr:hypothetical protein GALMADRAFT_215536 [Galerina marginata CBS 339.88]
MGIFVWQGRSAVGNSMLAAKPDCFSSLPFGTLSSYTFKDDVDQSYSLTNFGLRIPLLVYRIPAGEWSAEDGQDGHPAIALTMANPGRISMELQTREDYDFVELAFLGKVDGQETDLAILLGLKRGQWKRISKEYIILPRPTGTTLQTKFIR